MVMRDAPAPEQPRKPSEPEKPKPTPVPQPIPQTGDLPWQYTVVAALETDVSQVPFNRTLFSDDADFLAFAQSLLDGAAMKTGVPITADSHLLVMVTCSYSWPDARYVIVAVKS